MEHAKKMALVEPRLLDVLQNQQKQHLLQNQHLPATTKSMAVLDEDMKKIWDRQDLSTEEKVTQYNQALQRYLSYKEQHERPYPVPVQSMPSADTPVSSSLEEDTLESIPKTMKNKAKLLLRKVKSHPDLKWSPKGEMIYKGQLHSGSHLSDLVNDLLRHRKGFEPLG